MVITRRTAQTMMRSPVVMRSSFGSATETSRSAGSERQSIINVQGKHQRAAVQLISHSLHRCALLNEAYKNSQNKIERKKLDHLKRSHNDLQSKERQKYYDRRHAGIVDPRTLSMIIDKPDTTKTTWPSIPRKLSGTCQYQ